MFAFFVRGADRAVERFRSTLDRDVVIFDLGEPEELPESPVHGRLLLLSERHRKVSRGLYDDLPWDRRARVLERYLGYLDAEGRFLAELVVPYRRETLGGAEEIRLDEVITRCLDCDVTRSITYFGREGAQRLARWLRFLDVPLFRRAPVIRRLAPAARFPDPTEAVSAAVRAANPSLNARQNSSASRRSRFIFQFPAAMGLRCAMVMTRLLGDSSRGS